MYQFLYSLQSISQLGGQKVTLGFVGSICGLCKKILNSFSPTSFLSSQILDFVLSIAYFVSSRLTKTKTIIKYQVLVNWLFGFWLIDHLVFGHPYEMKQVTVAKNELLCQKNQCFSNLADF